MRLPFFSPHHTRTSHLWTMVLGAALYLSIPATLWAKAPPPDPLILDAASPSKTLSQHAMAWVDPQGTLSVQAMEQQQDALPFAPYDAAERVRLGEHGALWIRFDALTKDSRTHWELELSRSGTDRIELFYRLADGAWHVQRAGDHLAVSQWTFPDRYPVFDLDSRVDAPVTYWVRIQHDRLPFSGELSIHSHDRLRELRIHQLFFLGAYFGMAALLIVVATAYAIAFRDSSFAAYALYTSLLSLYLAASQGVAGQFLWPHSAHWNSLSPFVLLPLAAVSMLLFLSHVIQPRRLGRWLSRLTLLQAFAFIALTALEALWPTRVSLAGLTVFGVLNQLLIAALIWKAWQSGDRWVRAIALGMLPVLLSGFLPALRALDLLSVGGVVTQFGGVIAAALEAVLVIHGLLKRSAVQHEAQTRASALRITEPLTGLTNRHTFMQRVGESLVRAQQYHHRTALLLVSLDNHGWFLAEHGREVADRALVLTGSLMRSVARNVDTPARVDDSLLALLMEGPVRPAQVVAAATAILAGGLRSDDQLPVGAKLRLRIVTALLPDESLLPDMKATDYLNWMNQSLADLANDKQKKIHPLNT